MPEAAARATMDFFAHEARARRCTFRLLVYFTLAVALTILAIYVALMLILGLTEHGRGFEPGFWVWNPGMFGLVSLGTLGTVLVGSVSKMSELSGGGAVVASSLGGRRVHSQTSEPDERKLMNVIEEMSIASGVPVPEVFILEDERAINAFAAGHSPSDAAIGVTLGATRLLTRDELQGVMAHEFSHILNGDMRMNLRLMGVLHGLLCLALLGEIFLRMRGGRKNPLPLIGLVLIVFGYIGVFFGRLIKSAISRQREYLADASAVQFTRNPDGLAGALRKIAGLGRGSRLIHSGPVEEASHLFFGNALRSSWFSFWATHPPLEERIRRIDPAWDGVVPRVRDSVLAEQPQLAASLRSIEPAGPPRLRVPVAGALQHASSLTPVHLACAAELARTLPDNLTAAAREAFDANALVYALLLGAEDAARDTQLHSLENLLEPPLLDAVRRLHPSLQALDAAQRLAVVELCLPALRRLPAEQFSVFEAAVQQLIESDQSIDLFEYAVQRMLRRHLEPHFRRVKPMPTQYYKLSPLAGDCAVLLSALAHVGHEAEPARKSAFELGWAQLQIPANKPDLLDFAECNLLHVDTALDRLAQLAPNLKKRVLEACAHTVAADAVIQPKEGALLRVVADTFGCPLPPLVQTEGEDAPGVAPAA